MYNSQTKHRLLHMITAFSHTIWFRFSIILDFCSNSSCSWVVIISKRENKVVWSSKCALLFQAAVSPVAMNKQQNKESLKDKVKGILGLGTPRPQIKSCDPKLPEFIITSEIIKVKFCFHSVGHCPFTHLCSDIPAQTWCDDQSSDSKIKVQVEAFCKI